MYPAFSSGAILGASNKDDPFRVRTADGSSYADRSDALLATLSRHGIDGLIVIGGDGSLRIAGRLGAKGVAVVAVPKTIVDHLAVLLSVAVQRMVDAGGASSGVMFWAVPTARHCVECQRKLEAAIREPRADQAGG